MRGVLSNTLTLWASIVCLVFGITLGGSGCGPKISESYKQGYQDGYEDLDSTNYDHADVERMGRDAEYRRGYRDGMKGREQEKEEKRGGLRGYMKGKW